MGGVVIPWPNPLTTLGNLAQAALEEALGETLRALQEGLTEAVQKGGRGLGWLSQPRVRLLTIEA